MAQTKQNQQQDAIQAAVDAALAQQAERMAALEAELEAAKAKAARGPRVKKPTVKQQKMLDYLRDHPDTSIPEACEAIGAGGKTEPHGFLWRLVVDGYLQVSLPEPATVESAEGSAQEARNEVSAAAQGV